MLPLCQKLPFFVRHQFRCAMSQYLRPGATNTNATTRKFRIIYLSRFFVTSLMVACLIHVFGSGIFAQESENGDLQAGINPEWHRIMSEKLNLWKFSEEEGVFQFRFWYKGQVIDLIQHPNYSNTNLVTYVYVQHRNRPQDTLTNGFSFGQITLSVEALHAFIQISGILDIPSAPMADGFVERHHPDDALIGFRDPSSGRISFISSTTYRLPQEQFSETNGGPEDQADYQEFLRRKALVEEFITAFSDMLELTESYSNFEAFHLKTIGGCFTRDGVEERTCYNNIILSFGYHAARGTPLGYYAGLTLNALGIYKPELSFGLFHRMDLQGHFSFKGSVAHHHKVKFNENRHSAYALYEYKSRKRPGNVDGLTQQLQRHCILYSTSVGKDFGHPLLSRTSVAAGASYITGDQQAAGPVIAVKFFSLYGAFALINKDVDYLISWNAMIPFRIAKKPWRFIQLGIDHERFRGESRYLFSIGLLTW